MDPIGSDLPRMFPWTCDRYHGMKILYLWSELLRIPDTYCYRLALRQ